MALNPVMTAVEVPASSSDADVMAAMLDAVTLFPYTSVESSGTNHVELSFNSGPCADRGLRAVLASSSGAPTPAMKSPDTFNSNAMLVGLDLTGGTFGAWDDGGGPYGGAGSWSGYYRFGGYRSLVTGIYVVGHEEAMAIVVQNQETSAAGTYTRNCVTVFGAMIDAHFASYQDTGERLFGMAVSGGNVSTLDTEPDWAYYESPTSQSGFLGQYPGNGGHHFTVFNPSTGAFNVSIFVMTGNAFYNEVMKQISGSANPDFFHTNYRDTDIYMPSMYAFTTSGCVGCLNGIKFAGCHDDRRSVQSGGETIAACVPVGELALYNSGSGTNDATRPHSIAFTRMT